MIVDDEEDALETIGMCLTDLGFSFESFTDSENAAYRFLQHPDMFPIVISDIRMPKLDGIDLGTRLLKARPDVHVILMTALDITDKLENRLRRMQVRRVLKKPFNLGELYSLIASSTSSQGISMSM